MREAFYSPNVCSILVFIHHEEAFRLEAEGEGGSKVKFHLAATLNDWGISVSAALSDGHITDGR